MKILVVCLGNICRSPMAEGILQQTANNAGLEWEVDSAGTSGWHVGEPPDRRAIQTCKGKGIDISDQRSRKLVPADFDQFHVILTMDDANYQDVLSLAPSDSAKQKVRRIMDFSAQPSAEVPDPYYDGRFEEVFDMLYELSGQVIGDLGRVKHRS